MQKNTFYVSILSLLTCPHTLPNEKHVQNVVTHSTNCLLQYLVVVHYLLPCYRDWHKRTVKNARQGCSWSFFVITQRPSYHLANTGKVFTNATDYLGHVIRARRLDLVSHAIHAINGLNPLYRYMKNLLYHDDICPTIDLKFLFAATFSWAILTRISYAHSKTTFSTFRRLTRFHENLLYSRTMFQIYDLDTTFPCPASLHIQPLRTSGLVIGARVVSPTKSFPNPYVIRDVHSRLFRSIYDVSLTLLMAHVRLSQRTAIWQNKYVRQYFHHSLNNLPHTSSTEKSSIPTKIHVLEIT